MQKRFDRLVLFPPSSAIIVLLREIIRKGLDGLRHALNVEGKVGPEIPGTLGPGANQLEVNMAKPF